MSDFQNLAQAVIGANQQGVKEITRSMIDGGVDPVRIINEGLIPGMNVVGVRFKAGDMFVPEVMMSAKAMSVGIEMVKPLIAEGDMPSQGTVVMGTVKGDLHDIGKNLVIMMLESAGFKVIDLGVDVPADTFVKAVKEHRAQIVGLSALLTTTMLAMKATLETLRQEGVTDRVKVIVGGAPVSQEFADQIGADGYAPDAAAAAELCRALVS
ncbi:methyltransferase [Clostridiales bacterium PH28_bin88]|nr:methyltransferase [Clostridiales bacterium PH28_bin88]